MLAGNVGDIDLLSGLVAIICRLALDTFRNVIGIDTVTVPCRVQIDRCVCQHHAIGLGRIDILLVVVEPIGHVIDIRLRHIRRRIALEVFVHHVGDRHTAGHRGNGQKQDHRDNAHRKAHRVDLGRKLAHGKHVEAAPIHAAQALQQLDKHARKAPEQGKGTHRNHGRGDTKLVHGLLQLTLRRGEREPIAQQAVIGHAHQHHAHDKDGDRNPGVTRLDALVAPLGAHKLDELGTAHGAKVQQ